MAPCPRLGGLECESEEGCALGSCAAIALCSCLCVWLSPASSCLHFPAPMHYNLGLQVKHALLPFDFFLPGYFYHNNRYNTRTVSHWTWSSLIHTDTLAQWALRTLLSLPPPQGTVISVCCRSQLYLLFCFMWALEFELRSSCKYHDH